MQLLDWATDMKKESILFGIIGLLAGLIIGFIGANSLNKNNAPVGTAAAADPNSALPPGHPGLAGAAAQAPGGAIPEVQAAIEKAKQEPDNFDAQMKAAEMYYRIRRFPEAIELLKRAVQLKPADPEALTQLGNAYFDSENYPEAEKWYLQSLAKKPDNINVRTDLGLTFLLREPPDYDRAIEEFKRSLAIDPKHVQTLQNLTVAYTKKGDLADAKATLAELGSAEPGNQALSKLREDIEKIGGK
jgi:tetratricopeptide (TPR) repeat protein